MARQFGDHTELSKEIAVKRELQAKRKIKQVKQFNIAAMIVLIAIGVISVGHNIIIKKSLSEEAAALTQASFDAYNRNEEIYDAKEAHDKLMQEHVEDGTIDRDYDAALKLFEGDMFVETITPIENNSLSELCQNICDIQNSINDYTYRGYLSGDMTITKEHGDLILQTRKLVTPVDNAFDVWANVMISKYYTAHLDEDLKPVGLPDKQPFKWISECDYTYSVITRTMNVTWKCVSNDDPTVIYAVAIGTYNADLSKITNLKVYETQDWYDLLNVDLNDASTDSTDSTEVDATTETDDTTDITDSADGTVKED